MSAEKVGYQSSNYPCNMQPFEATNGLLHKDFSQFPECFDIVRHCRESAPSEMNLSDLSADWPSLSQVEGIIEYHEKKNKERASEIEASSREKPWKTSVHVDFNLTSTRFVIKTNQYFVKCNLPAMDEKIPNILYIVTHYDVQVAALSSTSQLIFFCGQNMGLQKCSHRNNESASIQKTKSAPCCSKFLSKLAACGKYHPKPNKRRDDGAWLWDIHQPTASSFSRPRISTCGILDQVGSLLWAIFSSKQA